MSSSPNEVALDPATDAQSRLNEPKLYVQHLPAKTADRDVVICLKECLKVRITIDRSTPGEFVKGAVEFESLFKAEKAYATANGQRLSKSEHTLQLAVSPDSQDPLPSTQARLLSSLPEKITPGQIFSLCRKYGPVHRVTLHMVKGSTTKFGQSALVTFYDEADAERAEMDLHCSSYNGRTISMGVDKQHSASHRKNKEAPAQRQPTSSNRGGSRAKPPHSSRAKARPSKDSRAGSTEGVSTRSSEALEDPSKVQVAATEPNLHAQNPKDSSHEATARRSGSPTEDAHLARSKATISSSVRDSVTQDTDHDLEAQATPARDKPPHLTQALRAGFAQGTHEGLKESTSDEPMSLAQSCQSSSGGGVPKTAKSLETIKVGDSVPLETTTENKMAMGSWKTSALTSVGGPQHEQKAASSPETSPKVTRVGWSPKQARETPDTTPSTSPQQAAQVYVNALGELARLPAKQILADEVTLYRLGMQLTSEEKRSETLEFMRSIKHLPVHDRKQNLGERIYPAVKTIVNKGAPGVTIWLLDHEDLDALAHLADLPELFKAKVLDAAHRT
ncbi:hypothetical protein ACM66B_003508 [Microbotryomycetes sp. NB124-2]